MLAPFQIPDTLAMDIGTGTKDVLHFSAKHTLENNLKFVVPTPALVMANSLEKQENDLYINGYTMGGGYLAKVLKRHRASGRRVVMERMPAFTIRNNLEEVAAAGIEIVDRIENPTHRFDEIELPLYTELLVRFGIDVSQLRIIAISAQDHGYNTSEESSRRNRFRYFLEHLEGDRSPRSLVFTDADLPEEFGRLASGARCVRDFGSNLRAVLVDTSFSAILGCGIDPRVAALNGPVLYINYGNGHTMACIMRGTRILSFFEHHTRILKAKPGVMADYMKRLAEGALPTDEVFDDDGNGCVTFEPIRFQDLAGIVVTGPQRHLIEQSGLCPFIEAAPGGDMMMTGPIGLLRGIEMRRSDLCA
ncbi:MAG TPA: DUF1786 family protein [Candidatus Ozemobacteraceae bacterium]|nr:DUF1786 family protein [Candidatus Ozemobacteraceae bacterium]